MMKNLTLLIVLSCLSSTALMSQTPDTDSQLTPSHAVAFKSGLSHLTYKVKVDEGKDSCVIPLPSAVHGTVWLTTDKEGLESTIARIGESESKRAPKTLPEMLQALVGHDVTVTRDIVTGLDRIQGRILDYLDDGTIIIKVSKRKNAGLMALPSSQIRSIETSGNMDDLEFKEQHSTPRLEVSFKSKQESAINLGVEAMARGLSWAPSYSLTLGETGVGRMQMKGVVINDLADMRDTEVRLAVGFPHLIMDNSRSPLLPEISWDIFHNSLLTSTTGATPFDNNISQIFNNRGPTNFGGTTGDLPEAIGDSAEDLFLFRAGRLSLKRGERAYVPLLSEDVKFKHRYDWDLVDNVTRHCRFVDRSSQEPTPVWHVVLLENPGAAPWTTSPILISGRTGPVSQSQLTYTPRGGKTKVKITKALNLVGESYEYRTDSADRDDTVYLYGNTYERVEIQGQLVLTHRGEKPSNIRIRKHLSGRLESADHDPKVVLNAQRLGQINESRRVDWLIDLKPGERWEANYTYTVLIRR